MKQKHFYPIRCLLLVSLLLSGVIWAVGCGSDAMENSSGALTGNSDADSDSDSDSDGDADADNVPSDTDSNVAPPDTDTVMDSSLDTSSDTATSDTADTDDTEAVCSPTEQVTYYLSADDSNSMASPIIARSQILSGNWVTTKIRPWEFLNYYSFNYQPADAGTLKVFADMRTARETEDGGYSMQIAVQSPSLTNLERRSMNIVLSVDTSGSMGGGPIDRLRQVCKGIAANLRDGDVVSIVKWDDSPKVILESHAVESANDSTLVQAIEGLQAGGSTNLYGGLQRAYQLASDNFNENRINRVVLISDGQANAGTLELDLIAGMSEDSVNEGILLTGVGTGNGYDDTLMDAVTDAGKGAYIYIDSPEEADRMFADETRFLANMEIAARDVQVAVTMPPGFYIQEFHGEEISTNKAEVDPQHLAYNDAMIFHQLVNTCGELPNTGDEQFTVTATFRDPKTRKPDSATGIFTLAQLQNTTTTQMRKGDAIISYALALEEIQPLTFSKSNYEAIRQIITATLAEVDSAATDLGDDPELKEISALLNRYMTRFN